MVESSRRLLLPYLAYLCDDDGCDDCHDAADTSERPDLHLKVADSLLVIVELFGVIAESNLELDELLIDSVESYDHTVAHFLPSLARAVSMAELMVEEKSSSSTSPLPA